MRVSSKQIKQAIIDSTKHPEQKYVLDCFYLFYDENKKKDLINDYLWWCSGKKTIEKWVENGYQKSFFEALIDKDNRYQNSVVSCAEDSEINLKWIVRHYSHATISIDCYVVTDEKDKTILFVMWEED